MGSGNRTSLSGVLQCKYLEIRTMPNRTTHRNQGSSKLYAERNKKGEFTDIQRYKRAHGQDVKRSSKAERARKH